MPDVILHSIKLKDRSWQQKIRQCKLKKAYNSFSDTHNYTLCIPSCLTKTDSTYLLPMMKTILTTRPAVTCNCGYKVLVSAGAPLIEQPKCSSEIDKQMLHTFRNID